MFRWHLLIIPLQALILLFFQSTGTGGLGGKEGRGEGGSYDEFFVVFFGRKVITMLGFHTHIKLLYINFSRPCVIPDPT